MEEVARVYGYNRFANTLPTALPVVAQPLAAAETAVRTRLLALGYSEAISSSFASEADRDVFFAGQASPQGAVAMENPLSEEARLLRPSLVPGMVAMLAHNLNRDVREVRLFEQGTVFTGMVDDAGSVERVLESDSLSIGLTGELPATRLHSARDAGIFELKGVVESLLSLFAASADAPGTSAAEAADILRRIRRHGSSPGVARRCCLERGRSPASESWRERSARRESCASLSASPRLTSRRSMRCHCGRQRQGSCRAFRPSNATFRSPSRMRSDGEVSRKRSRRWLFPS